MGICPGNATHEQIVLTVAQSADLVSGAPALQDVTRECDTLSVGIGFSVAPVKTSTTVAPARPPPPDECGP